MGQIRRASKAPSAGESLSPTLAIMKINVFHAILDLLFPIHCLGCGKEKIHCCDGCLARIPRFGNLAGASSITTACRFQEHSLLSTLIHHFKYDGVRDIGPRLVQLLPPLTLPKQSFLIPVPLHWRRENIRGFNQSTILAHEIKKKIGSPVIEILKRHRYPQPQIELSRQKRLTNLVGAFSMKNSLQQLDPRATYILVDDVSTTGATLNQCTAVLKNYGAQDVRSIVIARTV